MNMNKQDAGRKVCRVAPVRMAPVLGRGRYEAEDFEAGGVAGAICDHDLVSLGANTLKERYRELGLSKQDIKKLRERKRTLRSRRYAVKKRQNKANLVEGLQSMLSHNLAVIADTESANERIRVSLAIFGVFHEKLLQLAERSGVSLRVGVLPADWKDTSPRQATLTSPPSESPMPPQSPEQPVLLLSSPPHTSYESMPWHESTPLYEPTSSSTHSGLRAQPQ